MAPTPAAREAGGWSGAAAPAWALATLFCVAASLALRAYSFPLSVIDWDETVYVITATRWLEGGLPYIAVWDHHPVGLPALLMLPIRLTGDALLGARLASAVAVGLTAAILLRIGPGFLASRAAGLAAAALYLIGMMRYDALSTQTELFNNLCVAFACWRLLEATAGPDRFRDSAAAGLAFGIGLQIKYSIIVEALLPCLVFLALAGRRAPSRAIRHAVLLLAGGIAPTLLAAAYYWQAGALGTFLDANFAANLAYVGVDSNEAGLSTMVWAGVKPEVLLLIGAAALPVLAARRLRTRRERLLLGGLALWLLAAAIDLSLTLKFWRHCFLALQPPLCVAAGFLGVVMARRAPPRLAGWVFATTVAVLGTLSLRGAVIDGLVISARLGNDVPRRVADEIRRGGTDGQDVFVFTGQPVIYHLAGVRPPSRYVLPTELTVFAESSGAGAAQELARILSSRPRWIITADSMLFPLSPAIAAQAAEALRDYAEVGSWIEPASQGQGVTLYRRR